MSRRLITALVIAAAVILVPAAASAHPLGNFTVNTYSGLRVAPDHIRIDFVVDMAEIPALQKTQQIGREAEGRSTTERRRTFQQRECRRLGDGLHLRLDGTPLALDVTATGLAFPPGQAGLDTLRLTCSFLATPAGQSLSDATLAYGSDNFTDRIGWREITAVGDRVTLVASPVPTSSVSAKLTRYPNDLLSAPLDQRTVELRVRSGGPAYAAPDSTHPETTSPLPRGLDQATQAFTSFVGRQDLSLGFAALALVLSVLLGAIHALAPGHGKTMMAAYLVGQRGSLRQAVGIGLTVTATHTAGVLVLGLAISMSAVVAPERLYPWLGLASGLLLAAIGVGLLRRVVRSRSVDHHHHDHEHDHYHDHAHDDHHRPEGRLLLRQRDLLAIGFVGGFLPSPSAVVVLLGAMALGRTWFGLLLVVAYGLGMAATLTGAGLFLLRARGSIDRRVHRLGRRGLQAVNRFVPLATAVVIMIVGSALALRAAVQIPR
jgi:ABC-type nickel/cobalt efflux system permease component RcnA